MRTISAPQRALGLAVASALLSTAWAGVSQQDAARLGQDLTPLGATKAGTADGAIPPWEGGLTTPGRQQSGRRSDPFSGEKPLYSITAQNAEKYAKVLAESQLALLKRYPQTYRLDVYPTHRTAAAPQWVYDQTRRNATQAKSSADGYSLEGAYGGIPFPIPKTGAEAMWNHLLGWRGTAWTQRNTVWFVKGGRRTLLSAVSIQNQLPYYFPEGESSFDGIYQTIRQQTDAPPIRAGEAILGHVSIDPLKVGDQAWVYITGQRRVRKLPVSCCDTPTPASGGQMNFDEVQLFTGRLDRYDWKLLGKREMIVPYNANGSLVPKQDADLLGLDHLNPDHVRWELHRVWVVEATLRSGQRHVKPKRRFYLDEDSWMALLSDAWDGHDQLWSAGISLPVVAPEMPGLLRTTFVIQDLLSGSYAAAGVLNEQSEQIRLVKPAPPSVFTPEALAGAGVR